MGTSVSLLRRPLRRKLGAAFRGRPWFIEVDPAGFIMAWPRRGRQEAIHIESIYVRAFQLRKQREALARKKSKGGKR